MLERNSLLKKKQQTKRSLERRTEILITANFPDANSNLFETFKLYSCDRKKYETYISNLSTFIPRFRNLFPS